jgi:hypothetical protein
VQRASRSCEAFIHWMMGSTKRKSSGEVWPHNAYILEMLNVPCMLADVESSTCCAKHAYLYFCRNEKHANYRRLRFHEKR